MQNENPTFIDVIIATCSELEDTIKDYCDRRNCSDCDFNHHQRNCRYKTNLLMLLNGYRMGTCSDQERKQIDAYLQANYPSFMRTLDNINP